MIIQQKSQNKFQIKSATLALLILIAGIISSCSSTGIERSEKATTTMEAMDNYIKLVVVQLDATGASLDELMRPGQQDVIKTFDLYSSNVKKLEVMEKDFAKHAESMKTRGNEYFEEWQKEGKQYKNYRIQQLSDQRRNDLLEYYKRIAENSVGLNNAFKVYVSNVKEIQFYLSNDLTTKGIVAITALSQRVVSDGDNLKMSIKNVQTAIDKVRSEMAQNNN